jgi:hypothetical protein
MNIPPLNLDSHMSMILNFTKSDPTIEERAAGVGQTSQRIRDMLTFETIPTLDDVKERAAALRMWVESQVIQNNLTAPVQVMIAEPVYLMSSLERELMDYGFVPVYSYGLTSGIEELNEEGYVGTFVRYRHSGFIVITKTE